MFTDLTDCELDDGGEGEVKDDGGVFEMNPPVDKGFIKNSIIACPGLGGELPEWDEFEVCSFLDEEDSSTLVSIVEGEREGFGINGPTYDGWLKIFGIISVIEGKGVRVLGGVLVVVVVAVVVVAEVVVVAGPNLIGTGTDDAGETGAVGGISYFWIWRR